ncbi:uncharacterized protein LOC110443343 isoform X2 [Mizuhopecten yessoensis]|uniref:uncharacterized protein LOC110443343 isoform X2 n=1 Tax=Mizuhopecten yessoensis TaxID=6573 RepID=UPI000B45D2C2|nr:uncharacterized protein LOC110443343 isoform X2 [Mizuhopecten yessoensis]
MAGCLVRARSAYRLLNSGLASCGSINNATYLFRDLGFKFSGSSPCSSLTREGKGIQRLVSIVGRLNYSTTPVATVEQGKLAAKVLTDSDADIHRLICIVLNGRSGQNIKNLRLRTGLDFDLDTKTNRDLSLLVLGADAEVLKSATEKVTQEVKRIRNRIEKVFVDEDVVISYGIYRCILGKEGQNIQRLRLETGLDFHLSSTSTDLLVHATDAEVLKSATEKVTQEVQRMKTCIEKLFTDEDVDIHKRIYKGIIGKRGQNIQRLRLETGLDFNLSPTSTGLLVLGADAEVLKSATEKVAQIKK